MYTTHVWDTIRAQDFKLTSFNTSVHTTHVAGSMAHQLIWQSDPDAGSEDRRCMYWKSRALIAPWSGPERFRNQCSVNVAFFLVCQKSQLCTKHYNIGKIKYCPDMCEIWGVFSELCFCFRQSSTPHICVYHISMVKCKRNVTPLLTHWSYVSSVLRHRFVIIRAYPLYWKHPFICNVNIILLPPLEVTNMFRVKLAPLCTVCHLMHNISMA